MAKHIEYFYLLSHRFRLSMVHAVCKDGGIQWKTRTFALSILMEMSKSSVCSMVMEVQLYSNLNTLYFHRQGSSSLC